MRVGVIGFGFIGSEIFRRLQAGGHGLEAAFVYNRSKGRLTGAPANLVLHDLRDAHACGADLVVEMAGPEVTREHGEALLAHAHYMPLSLAALADDDLRARLLTAAAGSGRSLCVAHGALAGLEALLDWRAHWREVSVEFRKPPASLGASDLSGPTVLFDGSVREIAPLYPHNVNAMVACALATVGLDRCRARLVADPGLTQLELHVEATAADGSRLSVQRHQTARGVSGSEMADAAWGSILRMAAPRTLAFV